MPITAPTGEFKRQLTYARAVRDGHVDDPDFLPLLRDQLTTNVVADWFAHRIRGRVERYELPGIDALNFVLRDALGGGGISSLRFDPQGKAYAQQLLDKPLHVPKAWLRHEALAPVPEVEAMRSSARVTV